MATHSVTNQVPPLPEWNLLETDPGLGDALARWTTAGSADEVGQLAGLAGTDEWRDVADQADRHPPVLRTHTPRGERLDEVEFHPAWHRLLDVAVGAGLTAEPWTQPGNSGSHLRRAAGFYVWSQVEAGHLCPVSMTYAAVPALRASPALAAVWEPRLASRCYQPALAPGRVQARRARRDGHDREAGRLGRPRHHHPGRADR